MTTYNAAAVANSVIAHEKGITLQQGRALRDNPLAIAEADASVPDELLPTVLLGTVATTSGTSVSFTSLDLAPFKFARMVFSSVSITTSDYLEIGSNIQTVATVSPGGSISGFVDIELASGIAVSNTYSGSTSAMMADTTGYTNASTTITVTANTGGFDAGTIRLYGMK